MYKHHQQVIAKVSKKYKEKKEHIALLLTGSVARGNAVTNSDVDFQLIVSETEYKRRIESGDSNIIDRDIADYPGGYADVLVYSLAKLKEFALAAGELMRYAYVGVKILWSRDTQIEHLIKKISHYQDKDHDKKISLFHTQVESWLWYCKEAKRHKNKYFLFQASSRLLLFGIRLILCHNRMLYPYHKWCLNELERASDKPKNMLNYTKKLMNKPSYKHAKLFADSILQFRDWGNGPDSWPLRLENDNIWMWENGHVAIEDW